MKINNKIKLLLVTGVYPPEIGGPATHSAFLKNKLPQHGISVRVLPFRYVRKFPKIIRHPIFLILIALYGYNGDVFYAQDPVSVGFPTMLVAKLLRKKFILRIAGDYAWEQAVQRYNVEDLLEDFQHKKYKWQIELMRKIQTFTAKHADMVICPSMYFCNIVGNWGNGSIKPTLIYNGVDFEEINRIANGGYISKTIISAGRLIKIKNFSFLIEAMKNLTNEWKLFIVGEGPERNNLERIVNSMNLGDRVSIVGQLNREELLNKILRCEIFALCSYSETFSYVTVEAMRLKVPVVATNVGSLKEIVSNGETGFLFQNNDMNGFLDSVQKLTSETIRRKIVDKAFIESEKFSIDKMTEITANQIRKILLREEQI